MSSEDLGTPSKSNQKDWAGIIKEVTGLPQLIALMVLVVETVLGYVLYKSPDTDPLRIWYVVLMLLFFFGTVIALVIDRYLDRIKTDQTIQKTFSFLGRSLRDQYGIEAESLTIRVEIDLQGGATHTREWKGIAVLSDSAIPFLPGKFLVSESGKIESPPELLSSSLSKSKKNVRLELTEPTGSEFRVYIEGLLYSTDGVLSYEVRGRASRAVLMTKEEVDVEYKNSEFKYEYVSQDVSMLVKRLDIEVVFPEGFGVTPHPGVFFGSTEILHNLELRRVSFEYADRRATLSVSDPLVGLTYLIYWTPPPANPRS